MIGSAWIRVPLLVEEMALLIESPLGQREAFQKKKKMLIDKNITVIYYPRQNVLSSESI